MSKIKICGLSQPMDIRMVNAVRPDYVGFVFANSRRQVTDTRAIELKDRLDPDIKAVGVFVNEHMERIIRLCKDNVIDLVQLHGDESERDIINLKEFIPNPIIKAVRVRTKEDITHASQLSCDYLLFDTYSEDQYGGSGETFDWSMISKVNKPFFLAGGIHIGNVALAIRDYHPYGIDVSSGVETDGYKDGKKINEIVRIVRELS